MNICLMKSRGKGIKHEYLFDREEECLMKSLVQNNLSTNFIKHEFFINHQFDTRGKPNISLNTVSDQIFDWFSQAFNTPPPPHYTRYNTPLISEGRSSGGVLYYNYLLIFYTKIFRIMGRYDKFRFGQDRMEVMFVLIFVALISFLHYREPVPLPASPPPPPAPPSIFANFCLR